MGETKRYEGSCHCGKVKYAVTADVSNVISCNCSLCSRKGWLLAFVPKSQVEMLSGEGEMTDYQFNKHMIHHTFCPVCGVAAIGTGPGPDGGEMHAINVRCLAGVDLDSLNVQKYDGRSA